VSPVETPRVELFLGTMGLPEGSPRAILSHEVSRWRAPGELAFVDVLRVRPEVCPVVVLGPGLLSLVLLNFRQRR
jgi:hypothetical protein